METFDALYNDGEFESVSIATSNSASHIYDVMEKYTDWSLAEGGLMTIYQPFEAGTLGTQYKGHKAYWKKILFDIECTDTPEHVVMIGDSHAQDVVAPQKQGLRTVLLDRKTKPFRNLEAARARMLAMLEGQK